MFEAICSFQLVGQLVEQLGRRHVGGAAGAAIRDPQQFQLGGIDHRRHAPLGNRRARAEDLRLGDGGRAKIDQCAGGRRVGDLRGSLAEVHVPGKRGRVGGERGQVAEHLLVLQLRQGAPLVDGPLTEPPGGAAGRAARPIQKMIQARRMAVRGCAEGLVHAGSLCRLYRLYRPAFGRA